MMPPIVLFVEIINDPLTSMLLKLTTKISLVRIANSGSSGYPPIIKNIIDIQFRYLSLNKSSSFPPVVDRLNFFAKYPSKRSDEIAVIKMNEFTSFGKTV